MLPVLEEGTSTPVVDGGTPIMMMASGGGEGNDNEEEEGMMLSPEGEKEREVIAQLNRRKEAAAQRAKARALSAEKAKAKASAAKESAEELRKRAQALRAVASPHNATSPSATAAGAAIEAAAGTSSGAETVDENSAEGAPASEAPRSLRPTASHLAAKAEKRSCEMAKAAEKRAYEEAGPSASTRKRAPQSLLESNLCSLPHLSAPPKRLRQAVSSATQSARSAAPTVPARADKAGGGGKANNANGKARQEPVVTPPAMQALTPALLSPKSTAATGQPPQQQPSEGRSLRQTASHLEHVIKSSPGPASAGRGERKRLKLSTRKAAA